MKLSKRKIINFITKLLMCMLGNLGLIMIHILDKDTPQGIIGLSLGGEVILLWPSMGWTLLASIPVICFAIDMHNDVRAFMYTMLIRYRGYTEFRINNYINNSKFCILYVAVMLLCEVLEYGYLYRCDYMIALAAAMLLLNALTRCAVFQWLYLRNGNGEKILMIMIAIDTLGCALGYIYPATARLFIVNWGMIIRSELYSEFGYSIIAVATAQIAVILISIFSRQRLNLELFSTSNKKK